MTKKVNGVFWTGRSEK